MDRLKDFIEKNREAFEHEPLPEGHETRFRQRLDEAFPEKRTRRFALRGWAVPVAAALIGWLCWQFPALWSGTDSTAVCELHTEVAELRTYYQMEMDDILMQMEAYESRNDNPAYRTLLEESRKITHACNRFDAQVLPTLPCSDEAVQAIQQQYGNSLNSLHILYAQMQRLEKSTIK
ncbi:hypothetical protein B5F77_14185 [Parabacteroides sp. An277]|uniref:hypothetical protein n=1 Tax=Parabacteroides sp. An277 TaxID=1965619 RepID=UPI000B37828D|nr:hypothetical protein [Parabacteroides sp. An277]OUO49729.1 hypothetical protein B5F77_14185 [Parabacteroides sp. An277]